MDGRYFASVLISTHKTKKKSGSGHNVCGSRRWGSVCPSKALAGIVNFAASNPTHFSYSQILADQTECKSWRVHSYLVSSLKCGTSHCAQVYGLKIRYKKTELSWTSSLPSLRNLKCGFSDIFFEEIQELQGNHIHTSANVALIKIKFKIWTA